MADHNKRGHIQVLQPSVQSLGCLPVHLSHFDSLGRIGFRQPFAPLAFCFGLYRGGRSGRLLQTQKPMGARRRSGTLRPKPLLVVLIPDLVAFLAAPLNSEATNNNHRPLVVGRVYILACMDQGPVHVTVTGTTRPRKSSSVSTNTNLFVFVRPLQRPLTFSSNSTSTVWPR